MIGGATGGRASGAVSSLFAIAGAIFTGSILLWGLGLDPVRAFGNLVQRAPTEFAITETAPIGVISSIRTFSALR